MPNENRQTADGTEPVSRLSRAALGATSGKRIALVEIGSRSVRCLVADVTRDKGVTPVFTRAVDLSLWDGPGKKVSPMAVTTLLSAVQAFKTQAVSMNATKVRIFGTETLRRVPAGSELDVVLKANGIEVVDQRTEAVCSFVAGVEALPRTAVRSSDVVVIDQGSGSTEFIRGTVGQEITVGEFRNVPLGGNGLVDRLRAHEFKVEPFRQEVVGIVDKLDFLRVSDVEVVIQGTVATKCAWLSVREGTHESYNGRRVQGVRLTTKSIGDMIRLVEGASAAKWKNLRAIVNPKEPFSDGLDRMVAGAVPLVRILERMGRTSFYVSANGTRHGMALLMAGQKVNDG